MDSSRRFNLENKIKLEFEALKLQNNYNKDCTAEEFVKNHLTNLVVKIIEEKY